MQNNTLTKNQVLIIAGLLIASNVNSLENIIRLGHLPVVRGNWLGRNGINTVAAMSLAIEQINQNSEILPGVNLSVTWKDIESDTLKSVKILTDMYISDVAAFFGPEISCSVEATMTSAWNRIMMSYNCEDATTSNKTKYPTFVRVTPPSTGIAYAVLTFLNHYDWRTFTIFIDTSTSRPEYTHIGNSLVSSATKSGLMVNVVNYSEEPKFFDMIDNSKNQSRIFVFLGQSEDLVRLMSTMANLRLFENGEYLVIYVDETVYSLPEARKYLWKDNDLMHSLSCKENPLHETIAKSLVVISPTATPRYRNFTAQVNRHKPYVFQDPFENVIPLEAANAYDAVFLYAKAVDKLWSNRSDFDLLQIKARDGIKVFGEIVRMKEYESVIGVKLSIDENGDSVGNYSVIAYQPHDFVVHLLGHSFTCDYSLLPIGNFWPVQGSMDKFPRFNLFSGVKIHWMGGKPPNDQPKCGFKNENCPTPDSFPYLIMTAGILLVIIILLIVLWIGTCLGSPKKILTGADIAKFRFGSSSSGDSNKAAHEVAQDNPYNEKRWETHPGDFAIHFQRILGQGAFGVIYSSTVKSSKAAAKTVHTSAGKMELLSLMSELKVMIAIGTHENVVALLGAWTRRLHRGKIYLFLEFCDGGNLQNFLRNHRPKLYQPEVAPESQPPELMLQDLITWSFQISSGMTHLAQKNVVHGDLAARNILLSNGKTAKISDFGLSRKLYQYEEYQKSREYQEPLPWRWMAIETLQDLTLSEKSDVWSFGVTLWEIYSFAEIPYPGLEWTTNFISQLKNNLRLEKPYFADDVLFEKMNDCWNLNPAQRPDFKTLKEFFSTLLEESSEPSGIGPTPCRIYSPRSNPDDYTQLEFHQ